MKGFLLIGWISGLAATTVPATVADAPSAPGALQSSASLPETPEEFAISGRVTIHPPDSLVPPNLARVVVYLEAHPHIETPTDHDAVPIAERPQIAQRNKAFVPDFLVVPIGTHVEFPNWDDFSHNVFSRSAAAPPFDLERYGHGLSKSYQFTKVGAVQVFCNIHPNMRAIVFVTPNELFDIADGEGRFTIENVPLGTYELVAWHPRCQPVQRTVEVTGTGMEPLDLTLEQSVNRILEQRVRHDKGVTRGLGVKREQLDLPVVSEVHPACCPESEE